MFAAPFTSLSKQTRVSKQTVVSIILCWAKPPWACFGMVLSPTAVIGAISLHPTVQVGFSDWLVRKFVNPPIVAYLNCPPVLGGRQPRARGDCTRVVTGWHPVTVFFPREEARCCAFTSLRRRSLPSLCFPYCEFLLHRTRIGIEANSFVNFPDLQHLIVMVSLFFFWCLSFFLFFPFFGFLGKSVLFLVMKPFVFSKVFVIEPLVAFLNDLEFYLFIFLPDALHYQLDILSMKHFSVFCLTSVFFSPFCLFVLLVFLLLLLLRTGKAFQCWSFSFVLERSLFFKSIFCGSWVSCVV